MDTKIFNSISTYMDMYRCLADASRSKEELVQLLIKDRGKPESTARMQGKKAEEGEVPFVKTDAQGISLDKEALEQVFLEARVELGMKSKEIVAVKRPKPEDDIPTVMSGHSPEFKQMRESVNDVEAMEKRYKSQIAEKEKEIKKLKGLVEAKLDDLVYAYAMQKILVTDSAKERPEELFQKDFFKTGSKETLPVDALVARIGGKTVNPYVDEIVPEKELTKDNYFRRIMKMIFEGGMFSKKWGKSENLEKQIQMPRGENPEILEERKRLQSINEILAMEHVPNQVKLSLYAMWFKDEDPEMVELLSFAGKYDINADYVIRIMEKPGEYRNYRTMRGLLQQAREASEIRIKREAAIELLNGDWYVEADYMGKPCKFAMMPVDEMKEFLQLLKNHESKDAVSLLESMLAGNRRATQDANSNKVTVEVQGKKTKRGKKSRSQKKTEIATPEFLHAQEEGIDMHPEVNDDAAYDAFAESEVKRNE